MTAHLQPMAIGGMLPVPDEPAAVAAWYEQVRLRSAENRCWRCGLNETELDELGRDTAHWNVHVPVADGPICAQSCCRPTAQTIETVFDRYFRIIAVLTTVRPTVREDLP